MKRSPQSDNLQALQGNKPQFKPIEPARRKSLTKASTSSTHASNEPTPHWREQLQPVVKFRTHSEGTNCRTKSTLTKESSSQHSLQTWRNSRTNPMAGLIEITLRQATNSTTNCFRKRVQCTGWQPKSKSNPKRTVNLCDQALQPDPRQTTDNSTKEHMAVYHITTVPVVQPPVDNPEIPAQMMIISHPLGAKTPFGDAVPQPLPDLNLSQVHWANNKSDSSH